MSTAPLNLAAFLMKYKDMQVSAGFQRYSFDASAGLNPFGLAEYHPATLPRGGYAGDLAADILFTEFSFGF